MDPSAGPISGDLRLGGRDQLEGNAGGTIRSCEPPRHLAVTWEFGGGRSWVDVWLDTHGERTTLRLEHAALVDDLAQFDEYDPGAIGIGWDLSLLGLGEHQAFVRGSSAAWCRADIASGTPVEHAEAAAARASAFYTGG
jgi:hypothetical protein